MVPNEAKRWRLLRVRVIGFLTLPLLGLLLLRLWQVQALHGAEHGRATLRQSIRPIRLNPVRGRMICSDGQVLVGNRSHYDVVFHLSEMRQGGRRSNTVHYVLERCLQLAKLLGRPVPIGQEQLLRHLRLRPALPMTVFTDLTERELAQIAELTPVIPGLDIVPRIERDYPFPGLASHVLGFTGRRRPEDIPGADRYAKAYVTLELRGRSGLEVEYDEALSGVGGSRLVRVNTLGYVHEEIGRSREPEDGRDLVLTLDSKAQMAAEAIMGGDIRGALVVIDVTDGAVLAMASSPSYDLSTLTWQSYQRLRIDSAKPLLNRAVSRAYTPGSIVKPLVALAGLECGAITPEETWNCTGSYRVGNKPIRCWRRAGHGPVAVVEAIKYSCNPFFIHAGSAAGIDVLYPVFAAAGLGEAPAIALPGVASGIVPQRAFAQEHWGRNWIAIDTAYCSIGQGAVSITALQAALYTAAIANGGRLFRPYLLKSIRTSDGRILRNTAPVIEHRFPVSPEYIALVQHGMELAVNAEDGTAKAAKNPAISLAAKTGTAEVGSGEDRHKDTWVICYGPVENPRYAMACVVEHGQSGGRTNAPLAGQFFRQWLEAE